MVAALHPADAGRLLSEEKLTLAQVAKARGVHYSTVLRWVIEGRRGVRLEAYQLEGGLSTTAAALERFASALTARRLGQPAPDVAPSAEKAQKDRQRRANAARKEMARINAEVKRQRQKAARTK